MSDLGKLFVGAVILLLGLGTAGALWLRAEAAREQAEQARLQAEQASNRARLDAMGVSKQLIPVAEGVDTRDAAPGTLPSDPEAADLTRDNARLRAEADLLRQQLAELQAELAQLAAERR